MNLFRVVFAGSIGVLALSAPAFAQQRIQIEIQGQAVQAQPRRPAETLLLTEDAVAKLKLSDEQKGKYAKIDGEYKDKVKAGQETLRAAIQGVRDREKYKEAQEKFQTDTKKAREDQLAKVEKILTVDQKTVFTQVKQQQPQPGSVRAVQIGGPAIGQVLPPFVQLRLNLTDEQKKQIDDIQKEVDAKIMKVLTDEQKKQYEQIKKGGGVRPNPRPVQPNPGVRRPPAVPAVPAPPAKN